MDSYSYIPTVRYIYRACATGFNWKCIQGALGDLITKSLHTNSGRVRRSTMATNQTPGRVVEQTLSQKTLENEPGTSDHVQV